MAVTIEVSRWCDGVKLAADDWAARHEPQTAKGEPRVLALDGRPAKSVDLCDSCNDDMSLAEARVCVREFGVAPEAAKSAAAHERHPARSRGPAVAAAKFQMSGVRHGRPPNRPRTLDCLWCPLDYSQSGWIGHLQKAHGFEGTKDALGSQCPACGTDGFEMLTVHVSRAHHDQFASVTDAFIWARDNGDPYGVYAARRAAGKNIVDALPS